jgi:dTDP-4-dehydrorhamnose reductase
MRIMVTGAGGMLGKRVVEAALQRDHQVFPLTHREADVADFYMMSTQCSLLRPEVIINCAGAIPAKSKIADMYATNADGPLTLVNLASRYNYRFIHMSTDCVFAGDRPLPERYTTESPTDAEDTYGKTKALGEYRDNSVVVRGSFIGPDHGFLRWLLNSEDQKIDLWANAWWNGTSTEDMAQRLVELAESGQSTGIVHVASQEAQNKADLALALLSGLNIRPQYRVVEEPRINRVLEPTILCDPLPKTIEKIVERFRNA